VPEKFAWTPANKLGPPTVTTSPNTFEPPPN
jgi:hypothetical protein